MPFPQTARTFRLLLSIVIIALFVTLQSVSASGGVVWTGTYYNNEFLTGSPTFVRSDSSVAFNWGSNSPGNGINADKFSVRWTTDTYFEAGTYRFSVVADDNVYLRVDYPAQAQINTFSNPAVGFYVNVDLPLTAGIHHIQLDYQELMGDANVFLTWENLGTDALVPITNAPSPITYVPAPVVEAPLPVTSGGSGSWTAQYYGNIDFYGSPLLIVAEPGPSHNWGSGSPAVNIPADNFSARWLSFPTLAAGTYRVNARADDGIRVYIDGVLSINEWHAASEKTYTIVLSLTAGQHSLQVDYYEASGLAYLDFSIAPIVDVPALAPVVNQPVSLATGRVNTGERLNVRSEPDASAPILVKIRRTHTYPIIGRNSDNSWWQINVDGTIGWVYWRYIDVTSPQTVPVVRGAAVPSVSQAPVTGIIVRPTTNLNMRSVPSTGGAIIGRVPKDNQVSVVGRNASGTWLQINDGRSTGWISAQFAPLPSGTSVASIPVTG